MTQKMQHLAHSVQNPVTLYSTLNIVSVGLIKVCLSALYVFVLRSKALYWSTVTASQTTAKAFTNPFWGSCRETDPARWETITSYLAFQGWLIPTVCLLLSLAQWKSLYDGVPAQSPLSDRCLSLSECSAFFIQGWSAVKCPQMKRLMLAWENGGDGDLAVPHWMMAFIQMCGIVNHFIEDYSC